MRVRRRGEISGLHGLGPGEGGSQEDDGGETRQGAG